MHSETVPRSMTLLHTPRSTNRPASGLRLQRRIEAPRRGAIRNRLCGTPAASACLLALALGAATAAGGAAAGDAGPTAAAGDAPPAEPVAVPPLPAADPGPASTVPGAAHRDPTLLRVALLNYPLTLNPIFTAAPSTTIPGAQLFASLFRLDADGAPQPYLARRWSLSPARDALTVHLAPDARFHDGEPVTSADVAFSILATRDHHSFNTMLAAVAGVDTPSPSTAVIRLRHPHPALFMALSVPLTPILPAHVYDDGTPLAEHPANQRPVGSGPFRFHRRTAEDAIELVPFDDYRLGPAPAIERLLLVHYPNMTQHALGLARGEIDLGVLGPPEMFDLVGVPPRRYRLTGEGHAGIGRFLFGVAFNMHRPPFDRREVRRAIAHALDRETLYTTLLPDSQQPADGPFPPEHPFAFPAMDHRYPHDTARAEALLEAAGLPRGADGRRTRVVLLMPPAGPYFEAVARYIAWALDRSLGIEAHIETEVDPRVWAQRLAAGDFDLASVFYLPWGDPLIGLHRLYHSGADRADHLYPNAPGYANPAMDALLDAAGRTEDASRRKALYRSMQALAAEDLPYLWLSHIPFPLVIRRDLHFPLDSPWALTQPYDGVAWEAEAAPAER
jgi:peptide/nickel transport system substrate-binding protein